MKTLWPTCMPNLKKCISSWPNFYNPSSPKRCN